MNIENILTKIYNSEIYYETVDHEINDIVEMIRKGYSPEQINSKGNPDFKYLFEFAKSRIRVSRKFSYADHLFLDYYSSMYSTPEIIGKYRAERLKGRHIIDAGSGAGMQDIMFSMYSDVTGIEMNKSRYMMALLNRIPYKSKANFINDDFFNYPGDFRGSVIFSDPLRPSNSREKYFSQLSPNPLDSISISDNILGYAIDLPPHIKWENIPLKGEKEYISINGSLNRLTIYSPSLSMEESTAVILPENIIYSGKPEKFKKSLSPECNDSEYLFMPDISVVYAELLNDVIDPEWKMIYLDQKRYVFAGNSKLKSFPGTQYSILDFSDDLDIEQKLAKYDGGRVFFRFSMDPDESYIHKNALEKNLTGNKKIYVFQSGKGYIITEKVE
jgi:hypothetical protein